MKSSVQNAYFLIDLLTAKISEMLAERNGQTITTAMREFMATKTFAVLARPQSFLHLESPEYILDMLDAENTHDTERWLEV
ncbi:hypothetical protein FACS1894105_13560 [Clostridia bacterium]|nr:hypothetical protein FACS1894105_13560 [Clostridia bacterium]